MKTDSSARDHAPNTGAATLKGAATEARVVRGIERIGEALAIYAKASGTRLADLDDFICDLLHFADQGGRDVEALLRNARTNWTDER